MARRIHWEFILLNAAGAILFLYLIFVGGNADNLAKVNEVFYSNSLIFLLGAAALLVVTAEGKAWWQSLGFFVPLIAFYMIAGLSILIASDPWTSAAEYYRWGWYLVLFAGLLQIRNFPAARKILVDIFLLAGLLFIIGKLFAAGRWMWAWFQNNPFDVQVVLQYRPAAPNITAALSNLFLFAAGARLMEVRADRQRLSGWQVILFLVLLGSLALLWICLSRGALIGFVGGVLSIGVLVLFSAQKGKQFGRAIPRKLALVGLLSLFPTLYLLYQGFVGLARGGLELRWNFWSEAIGLFRRSPFTGVGIYGAVNYTPEIFSVPPDVLHNHFHSVYITVLAELGIPGLLMLLVGAIALVGLYFKEFYTTRDMILLAAVGCLGSFFAHGLVDTLYIEPAYSFALTIVVGLTLPRKESPREEPFPAIRWGLSLYLVFFIGLGGVLVYQRAPLAASISSASEGLTQRIAYLEGALERTPGSILVHQQLALVYSQLFEEAGSTKDGLLDQAIDHLEYVIEEDSLWPLNYANLGALYAEKGDYQTAQVLLQRAVALAPESPLFVLNLGVAAEQAGDRKEAREAYRKYLELRGYHELGPFWDQTELRQMIKIDPGWQVSLDSLPQLNEDQLLDKLRINPVYGPLRYYLARTLYDSGRLDEASREAANAGMSGFKRNGLLGMETLWLQACIAVDQGDLETGIELGKAAVNGWLEQTSSGPGTLNMEAYGTKKFLNPVRQLDLVPQMVLEPLSGEWIGRLDDLAGWCLAAEAGGLELVDCQQLVIYDSSNAAGFGELRSVGE